MEPDLFILDLSPVGVVVVRATAEILVPKDQDFQSVVCQGIEPVLRDDPVDDVDDSVGKLTDFSDKVRRVVLQPKERDAKAIITPAPSDRGAGEWPS